VTNQDHHRTRRGLLQVGLASIGGLIALRAQAQEKLAQNLVQYQETPKDGHMCSTCVNYVEPNGCKIVAGNINPNGWCVAWGPKA